MAAMLRRSGDAGCSRKVPSLPTGIRLFLAVVLLGNLSAYDISRVAVPVSAIMQDHLLRLKKSNPLRYFAVVEGDNINSLYNPENKVRVRLPEAIRRPGFYIYPVVQSGACGLLKRAERDFTSFLLRRFVVKVTTPIVQLQDRKGLEDAVELGDYEEGVHPIRVIPHQWIREALHRAKLHGPNCTVERLTNELKSAAQVDLLLKNVPKGLEEPLEDYMNILLENAAALMKTPVNRREQFCAEEEKKLQPETSPCRFAYGLWKYFEGAAICNGVKENLCTLTKETLRKHIHKVVDHQKDFLIKQHGGVA